MCISSGREAMFLFYFKVLQALLPDLPSKTYREFVLDEFF